jgi:hypothetical protein
MIITKYGYLSTGVVQKKICNECTINNLATWFNGISKITLFYVEDL